MLTQNEILELERQYDENDFFHEKLAKIAIEKIEREYNVVYQPTTKQYDMNDTFEFENEKEDTYFTYKVYDLIEAYYELD